MKPFLILFTLLTFLIVTPVAADNLIGDGNSGAWQLVDSHGDRWNAQLAMTTNGMGDIFTLGDVASLDNIIGSNPGGARQLIDNSGKRWNVNVLYTTDGAGHVIPVPSGGGGGGVTSVSGTAPVVSSGGTTPAISMAQSSASVDGYLAHADWSTFNNKQSLLSFSSPIVNTSGTISCNVSSGSQPGCLSSADWTTFNGKQAAGAYITALTGDVAASGPGSSAATIQPLAVTNSKIANGTIDLTAKVTGFLPRANVASMQVNQTFLVDGSRTDSYTADGSVQRPFKTIGAAISQIITNADNSTHPYTINVTPGAYAETLSFNSALLFNVTVTSTTQSANTQSTSVLGITSTSNNTNLATLIFNNITVNGSLNLTGDVNATNFGSAQVLFADCMFNNSGGTIVLNNVNNVNFYSSQIQGSGSVATFTNVAFAYMNGAEGFIGGTTLHLVQNNSGNQPSQSSGNYFLMSTSKNYATVTIDAGSEMDSLQSYFGSGSSVTNNGTIHSWQTGWNGTVTLNSGSTTRVQGDVFLNNPVVNTGATLANRGWLNGLGATLGTSAVAATNALIVTKDGHVKSTQTTAPTATPNANAGTGATCTVSHATDNSGTINLTTTATSPAAGAQCAVNFNLVYGVAPICTFSAANANAEQLAVSSGTYVTSSTAALTMNFASTDAVGHAYVWNYNCVETQ